MTAQQLKNSILQLAVQGKLVAQDPNDEPAAVLLERIRAEKERLVKEGEIKKEKPLPPISEGEIPFNVPETWEWVRIFQVCDEIVDCPHSTPKYLDSPSEYHAIDTNCIGKEHNIIKWRYVDKDTYVSRTKRLIPRKNDIIYTREGSIGFAIILPSDKNICMGQRVMLLRTAHIVDVVYLLNIITSESFKKNMTSNYRGIGAKHINVADVKSALIPLPPLAEQRRIVERIKQLLPHIADYDIAEQKLTALNASFPDQMKKSILQSAVQGKLVPQDENDEPASVLLEHIRAEKEQLIKDGKLKKEKPLPPIAEDEIPFDVPNGWEWVRLGSIIQLISGQDMTPNKYNADNRGIPYLTGASNIDNEAIIINRWTLEPKSIAVQGDLLITSKGTVGAMVIMDCEKAHIARQIMAVRMGDFSCHKFIKIFLETYVATLKAVAKSMIPGISRDDMLNALMPLPPLAEQHRIVAKCEKLMAMVEELR